MFSRIQLASTFSDNFSICNGVRQGGILSPFLFRVYIDELSLCLQTVNVGCRLSYKLINHLLFADDAVVFARSVKGLQRLLAVCSKFASSHNVIFNITKSQCLIVKSHNDIISRPTFPVCWASLPYTDSYKYLGHIIMRPSSLGGGRILPRTLSVCLSVCPSVCPSVPLSLPSVTSRHLANYNDTHVLFGTR